MINMLTFINVLEPHFNGFNYWTTNYNDQRDRNIAERKLSNIS